MSLLIVAAIMLPGGTPPPPNVAVAEGHVPPCRTHCVERRAMHRCRRGHVPSCITRAALHWRVPGVTLLRKARCESRLNPRAYNHGSGASGLFQFLPSTWRSTPYGHESVWSAKWASLGAAWMHRVGRGGEWSCR